MDRNGAIYVNIRGIYPKCDKSKVPYLSDLAQQTNAPFICVTETHLNPSILDAEISINGYDLFRSDRSERSHGGVAIYCRKDIAVKTFVKDSNSYCDSLILDIPQLNLVLINIYRPPNCPEILFNQTMEHTSNFLRNLESYNQRANTYLVVGDYNFPFLKDGKMSENKSSSASSEKKQANTLHNFANEFFLEQYITKPTRNKNILDLVFTNDHFLIHNYEIIVNSILSDHFTICVNLSLKTGQKNIQEKQKNHYLSSLAEYNMKDADDEDWYRLNLMLDCIDWDSILQELSTEESTMKFISILEEHVELIFKKKQQFQAEEENESSPVHKSKNKIPKPVRIMMRNKSKLSKSILRVKSVNKYLKMRGKLEELEQKLKDSYTKRRIDKEKVAISKIKKDPRAFFSYAKKFSKTKSEAGPFLNQDGDLISDSKSIADMLKSQYESVYSSPDPSKEVTDPEEFFSIDEGSEYLDNIAFDRQDVLDALDKLSANSAPGPDGIPSILLKKCKYSLADGLTTIFQRILSSGDIPDLLKSAFVIPVHKGGSRALPVNFRPVSLTSHLIKTLERIVRVSLVRYLELNMKMNPNQHGFRNQRSCLSHLLEHYDLVLSHLENGHNVDSIYLDFSKAFDKVDIGILCHKMKLLGICGTLAKWIHSFLTNRKQFVLVNGSISEVSWVKSGVPQGTVLGPILFLILINDIDKDVSSKVSLFADDTRVMGPINTEQDVEDLQADLNRIYDWQQQNNMLFNGKKFELLRYGSNEEIKASTNYLTPEYEDLIEVKENLRDLGITMSDDATFTNHINEVCSKVKQKCGWILRTFSNRETHFLKLMWKTLVQGHVDYCSQLYMPSKLSELQQIEDLQRWFTRKIPEVRNLNYWQRLKSLKMYSQQRRMERYRIIYTWKILEGLVPNCGLKFTTNERRGREALIPNLKGKASIKRLREQSFQVKGPKLFNTLPPSLRKITRVSVDEFKHHLDKYLEGIPDEPIMEGLVPAACDQFSAAPSNSIVDQARKVTQQQRRPGA